MKPDVLIIDANKFATTEKLRRAVIAAREEGFTVIVAGGSGSGRHEPVRFEDTVRGRVFLVVGLLLLSLVCGLLIYWIV